MELQQLRYVLAVAEERNFTRAAAKSHVVQSALSHQIKSLEHELGVQLFARTSRRVELTEAGTAFLPAARATLDAADRAVAEAVATTGDLRGRLLIGAIPTVTTVDLTAALGDFHRAHPNVEIGLTSGGSLDFVSAIRHSAMDVAVLGLAEDTPPTGVASEVLAHERLAAVMSPEHRFARRRRLTLSELAEETFVDFPIDSPGRSQSERAFSAAGLSRTVAFDVMSAEVMLDLVAQNLAVALLAPAVVPEAGGLSVVPIADGPSRIEYLAWSAFNPSPAALAFLDILRRTAHPREENSQ
ncbi:MULTISPECIES: LysR family transcriptional regulator [unclassified Brevibacterium]|uniref:LysR family transcriptional regulator n=1 Tax=unclassified Brevibacterium TaxID=2614124 RepID=UPI001E5521DF|nr:MULTISPECIES: LysR family transcriptional regulator [unclassified Brevibacterium]MCD1285492.1 LysR family transcriptional regulator [Brevibacterium sp. CCUG 69071]MDK8434544.1 LysR family transcriptional regulator [Brevibacterium sp. H-BE7]